MTAKITPLIRLPSTADVFDYFIPPDLANTIKPGQLVTIPWRSQETQGVVLAVTPSPLGEGRGEGREEQSKFRARPLHKIINPEPILTPAQLQLIKKFSACYFTPLGAVARLIIPTVPKRINAPKTSPRQPTADIQFHIEKKQLPALKSATAKITAGETHIVIADVSSFIFWLLATIKQHKFKQLLILLPTIHLIDVFAGLLAKKYAKRLAVVHSNLSQGQSWQAYQKILKTEVDIILSTRAGVFLPLAAQSTVVFFNSSSEDFKQTDQHPRYDARTVGRWLAESTGSNLIFASPTPFLGSQIKSVFLPGALLRKIQIELVDMKNELQKKDFSVMADKTMQKIEETAQRGKKVVILALRGQADQGVSVDKINQILTEHKNHCIVGLPGLLENFELSEERGDIGLLVIASIEPLLALPDYRSSERVYSRLKYWQALAQELQIPRIILQAYSPDNLAIRAFAYGEIEQFINSELANRKKFGYPPFGEIIKIAYKGQDQKEFNAVLSALQKTATKILGPYAEHRTGRKSLLLKIKNNIDIPLLRTLSAKLWAVDRDPENVL